MRGWEAVIGAGECFGGSFLVGATCRNGSLLVLLVPILDK